MKQISQIVFLLIASISFGQRSEFSLFYSKGIPTRNFSAGWANWNARLDYMDPKILSESSCTLRYTYDLIHKEKYRIKLGTGITSSSSFYSLNIIDPKYGYILDNAGFTNKLISVPLIVGIEKGFYNNKLFLELQFSLNKDMVRANTEVNSGSSSAKYDFIDYNYTVNAFYRNNNSYSIGLYSKYYLYKDLYFLFSLSYLSDKQASYYYTVNTTYHLVDQNTGATKTEYWSTQNLNNMNLTDRFYYLSAGLCYKFGGRKTNSEAK